MDQRKAKKSIIVTDDEVKVKCTWGNALPPRIIEMEHGSL